MLTLSFDGLYRDLPQGEEQFCKAGFMCYGWLILRSNIPIAQGHGVFARSKDANSNIAEFLALIEGLDALQDFAITGEPVRVCGDAKTIIDQMRGACQVHAANIKPLYRRARKLARRFSHIEWKWLPRQNNHLADGLTRKALRQIRHDHLNYNHGGASYNYAVQPSGSIRKTFAGHGSAFTSLCSYLSNQAGIEYQVFSVFNPEMPDLWKMEITHSRPTGMNANVEALSETILDELNKAIGFSKSSSVRRLLGPLFRPPAYRFAQHAYQFDLNVADYGFDQAARAVLPMFASQVDVQGLEYIPRNGPLLIVSNHPGICDFLVIAASLPRQDLIIVASGVPFVRKLTHVTEHLILSTHNIHERMVVIRAAVRHLKSGGALLIFPSGGLDPDPAIMPGAGQVLESWSPSLEVILKTVPKLRVLPTLVTGVLSTKWMRSPFTRLRRSRRDRQRVAEFCQVSQQILFPRSLVLNPGVYFAPTLEFDYPFHNKDRSDVLSEIIRKTKVLLDDYTASTSIHLEPKP